jgi:hypothetical protein
VFRNDDQSRQAGRLNHPERQTTQASIAISVPRVRSLIRACAPRRKPLVYLDYLPIVNF